MQSVFSWQLTQGRQTIFPGRFGLTRNLVLKLFEGSGKVALLKERAVCCPSLVTHGGHPRGRPLGLEVAQLLHRGLEVLSDIGGKWMQTRGAYESSKGYFPESKAEELLKTHGNS